jgi:biotin transporter BioY
LSFARHCFVNSPREGPTVGYLVGFVFAATLTGFMSEKAFDKTWRGSILSMICGTIVIYIFGVGKLLETSVQYSV